jgi:hypothetical protein
MKVRPLLALISVFAIVICFGISAQTVTVDASNGSPNNTTTFNSLQLAIQSFQNSGSTTAASPGGVGVNSGNAAANVINVVAGTPVDENVSINAESTGVDQSVHSEAITIQGSGGRGVVALQSNAAAALTVYGFTWRTDSNLTVNNMAFIPSATNTPSSAMIELFATTHSANTAISFNDVVVTSNDGSGAPLTLDGQGVPDYTGAVTMPTDGDAIRVISREEGGSITLNLDHVIISAYCQTGNGDGVIAFASGTTTDIINCFVNVGPGCVFSNVSRFGIQNDYGPNVVINGTHDEPVIFNNIGADAIWCLGDTTAPTQAAVFSANHAIFNNVGGSAIKEQETGARGFVNTIRNTIIANAAGGGISLYADGALPPGGLASAEVTVDHVTVHNCGNPTPPASYDDISGQIAAPTYTGGTLSNRNVRIVDTILSGSTAGLSGLYNAGTGTMNIGNSAIVTAGGNALTTATGGTGTINQTAVINDAVVYKNTTDPFSPDFFDVVVIVGDGSPYRTAGSGGGALTGGADLYEFAQTSVGAWNLYR